MTVIGATQTKPTRAPSLETVGMTKRFGPLVALEDVSIKVPAGSFHALLGENGAGKSTFLKILSGEIEATTGNISMGRVIVLIIRLLLVSYIPDLQNAN